MPEAPLQGLRILVVEDHEDSRELFRVMLEHLGASVLTAASIDEAIGEGKRARVDVVITDIALPERPGTWFVEEGRRSPVFASAAILAVTGRDLAPSLRGMFDGVAQKPVDPDHLCHLILDAVRRRPRRVARPRGRQVSHAVFVVARGRGDLFQHLRGEFADVADRVEVVYDRRLRERRERSSRVPFERRMVERRTRSVQDQLTNAGWAFVSRPRD